MNRSSAGGRRPGWLAGRLLPALLIGVAVYYAVWGGEYSEFDVRTLANRRAAAAVELTRLEREVDSLRVVEERLEDDPETIEAVARERFGMIREGELLYRFVEVDTASRP